MSQPPTHPPTDQEVPTSYLSIRLTLAHEKKDEIERVLTDVDQYIMYPHAGKHGDNEHWHLLIPEGHFKFTVEALRKRFGTTFGKGNRVFCVKSCTNGILNGIQYCSREGTSPITKGPPEVLQWIEQAPAWIPAENIGRHFVGRPDRGSIHPDHHKQLTYRNLLKATLRYRQVNGISSKDLEDTLEDMHRHNWMLCIAIIRGGIPATFYDEFTAQCNGTTVFKSSRFASMRTYENWRCS